MNPPSGYEFSAAVGGGGGGGAVASVFGRTGVVNAASGDYTAAQVTSATIDLVDRTDNTTETVPAGTTTNCSTAGVTKTAPAVAGSVGTPPLRWAVKNLSAGTITVAYPDQAGAAQSLTVLSGETRTFRQKTTSGWGVESGAVAVATLDARFAPITGSGTYQTVVNHGATAGTARPSGAGMVLWVGSVAPTNGVAGDQWRDTTLNATRWLVGTAWFYPPGLELGYQERVSNDTTTNTARSSAASNTISGLTVSGVVGTGQPVDIEYYCPAVLHSVAATFVGADLVVSGVGNAEQQAVVDSPVTASGRTLILRRRKILTAGTSYSFDIGKYLGAAGTGTYVGAANQPMHLSVTCR